MWLYKGDMILNFMHNAASVLYSALDALINKQTHLFSDKQAHLFGPRV